jgi:hypothetical protein
MLDARSVASSVELVGAGRRCVKARSASHVPAQVATHVDRVAGVGAQAATVAAQRALLQGEFGIAVGRCDEAHVHRQLARSSHRSYSALFQSSQQLGLHVSVSNAARWHTAADSRRQPDSRLC